MTKKQSKMIDPIQTYKFEYKTNYGSIIKCDITVDLSEIYKASLTDYSANNMMLMFKSGDEIKLTSLTPTGMKAYRKLIRDWKKFGNTSQLNWSWDYLRKPIRSNDFDHLARYPAYPFPHPTICGEHGTALPPQQQTICSCAAKENK